MMLSATLGPTPVTFSINSRKKSRSAALAKPKSVCAFSR